MSESLVLRLPRLALVVGASTFVLAVFVACSSSKTDTPAGGGLATSTAAAVAGAASTTCAGKTVTVDPAVCHVMPDGGDDHDHDHDGGEADGGAAEGEPDYGPTNYNSEADDDDCKYHVKWESTAVAQNTDVTFKIIATTKSDSKAVAAATPYAEIFLDDKTPAPNTPAKTTETEPGTYTIGPVQFNKPGNWNVRFHFHDECTDSEESPHGHVAFFVKVP